MERGDLSGAILDGRYRVIEPVAEGAMGVVYRAERMKLGRIVAIKVLHDVLPDELSGRKRFEIEAMAMAKLEHPHCASVLDVGVHGARPFVVMDFVSGQNLKELISAGPLAISRAAEIVRQVLSGLAHAHEHGVIHRDIKPANLVLSHKTGLGDHVKILDFGLARLHDTGQNLTSGLAVGTPAYMAPEQIRGQKIDHRADLYACGVLLFELLTGVKPYHSVSDDPIEVCKMHLSDPIPRLDAKLPGVDFGELEAVAVKALAKRAGRRYGSAEEFAAALTAAVGPPPRLAAMQAFDLARGEQGRETSYPPPLEVGSSDVLSSQPATPWYGEPADESGGAVAVASAARSVGAEAPVPVGTARAKLATPGLGTEAAGAARSPLAAPEDASPGPAARDAGEAAAEREGHAAAGGHAKPATPAGPSVAAGGAAGKAGGKAGGKARGKAAGANAAGGEALGKAGRKARKAGGNAAAGGEAFGGAGGKAGTPGAGAAAVAGEAGGARGKVATPVAGTEVLDAGRAKLSTPAAGIAAAAGGAAGAGDAREPRMLVATPAAGSLFEGAGTAGEPRSPSSPGPHDDGAAADAGGPEEPVSTFLGIVVPRTPMRGGAATPARGMALATPAAASRKRTWSWTRKASLLGAVAIACGAALAIIETRDEPVRPATEVASSTSGADQAPDVVARVNELVAQGDKDAALDLLVRSRRQLPDSAALPYAAGRIYFSRFYWSEGLKSFRDAIKLDPRYRSDPELIKAVLRGFLTTPSYNEDLASFLRDDIGGAARPMLEETARDHPSAATRTRAASELRRYR